MLAPAFRVKTRPSRTVAVVVPLSTRRELLPEEELSLRHLCHFLGKYDKYLVAPDGTSIQREGFTIVHFPRKFFGSLAAHNHLVLWPRFYQAFQAYEYILIYHLDSLVFSDQLMRWCQAGWDYIGAPWLPCADTPWVQEPRVGNGGFTLMKVGMVLQVLHNRYQEKPSRYFLDVLTRNGNRLQPLWRALEGLHRVLPRLRIVNRLLEYWRMSESPAIHGRNNDYFWSFRAAHYLPTFKVATVEDGLRFAFEAAPRMCFELNQRQLPFGCHAWTKFDRGFWEPHLLRAGGPEEKATSSGTYS